MPVRATFTAALEASLAMATLPLAAPAVFGAKFTEKLALCPAAIVAGIFMPLMVNPVPVTAAWLIATLVDPVFCRTTVRLELPFTCTVPKLTLPGFGASVPTPEPVAVPDREMVVLAACMSWRRKRALEVTVIETALLTEILPLEVPAALGE